jgi:sulfur relay (sulfurtransferase) complex TusBCD TusD component (DsrE family)
MNLSGHKLGILLAAAPHERNFQHALALAETGITRGVDVYLYCLDEAVTGLEHPRMEMLKQQGLKLWACAYGARRRHIPLGDQAVFGGLSVVSDLIRNVDRFVSFT